MIVLAASIVVALHSALWFGLLSCRFFWAIYSNEIDKKKPSNTPSVVCTVKLQQLP